MDARHFDALSRVLYNGESRRGLLALLATLPILSHFTASLIPVSVAGKGKHRKRCKPKKKAKVCAGNCGLVRNRKTCRKSVDCGPCACTPATCQAQNVTCGTTSDGCGGTLQCGPCPTGQVCQGGACGVACGGSFCPATTQICVEGVCQTTKVRCTSNDHTCTGAELQAAIDQGGTIYIGPGRYIGAFNVPQASSAVLIGAGMGEDPATNTILDARQGGRVMFVNFLSDLSLKSLRITGGNGCGGSGVVTDSSTTLIVEECAIVENGNDMCAGGGFFVRGHATIVKSLIRKNVAAVGGGIELTGGGGPLVLRGTEIRENTARDGGGLDTGNFATATLTAGTVVTANTATNANGGGGLFVGMLSTVTITDDSSIAGNTPNNCTVLGILNGTCA